jgi:biopolymer transport protein ExbB
LALLQLGAPASYLLLLLSVAAVTLIIVKAWEFREQGLGRTDYGQRALTLFHRGDLSGAQSLLASEKGPFAETLAVAIAAASNSQLTDAQAQEYARMTANEKLEDCKALLRPLEVIGQLAPLTGLLGTVLGMIAAFQALQTGGASVSAAELSGGIWEALLTTAGGILIALPSITAVNYFERVVERLQTQLESHLTRIFTPPVVAPFTSADSAALLARVRSA